MIGYLDKVIRSLVLIMLKMSGYVGHLKLKMEGKIKTIKCLRSYYKNRKLFGLRLKIYKNWIKNFASL